MLYNFTLSFHFFSIKSPKNHLDLFLEINKEGPLLHYFSHKYTAQFRKKAIFFHLGHFHRQIYLNYTGKIANNRGRVRVLIQGKYHMPTWIKEITKLYKIQNLQTLNFKKNIQCSIDKKQLQII